MLANLTLTPTVTSFAVRKLVKNKGPVTSVNHICFVPGTGLAYLRRAQYGYVMIKNWHIILVAALLAIALGIIQRADTDHGPRRHWAPACSAPCLFI
jgi:hypothetical protein